jgi:DNA-binding NarL/FixJ family response regulator
MPSVLIADDGVEIRKLVRRVIETIPGFTVCGEAVDGLEAVQKARALSPDLVILDLAMPRMNGLDAAHVLRTTGSRVPIILFTLHADILSASQVSAAGIDAIVPKIGDVEGLLQEVERLLAPGWHN